MTDIIKKLCSVSSVSSREDAFRECIKQEIQDYVEYTKEDVFGNLIAYKKGSKSSEKKIAIDVPMDECGVMVSSFTDDGFIKFQLVGQIDRRSIIGKQVCFGTVNGVVGMKPIHLCNAEDLKAVPELKDLYIDIGADNKKNAESLLELGNVGYFANTPMFLSKNLCKVNSLDSKITCALAINLIQSDLPVDCTFIFSAQKQVGNRGAYGASFSEHLDEVICLDGITSDESPNKSDVNRNVVNGGVAITLSDKATQYDRMLFDKMLSLADANNIKYQVVPYVDDSGNGRVFQQNKTGLRVIELALPVKYLHYTSQICSLNDANSMYNLIIKYLMF